MFYYWHYYFFIKHLMFLNLAGGRVTDAWRHVATPTASITLQTFFLIQLDIEIFLITGKFNSHLTISRDVEVSPIPV